MLTPQELQEKKFAKAMFGGYDMAEVDAFLDELTADYEALFKDSAVLKSKLKALAEKVEEYRSVDEEMRRTLAVAKRSADEMKAEADKYVAEKRAEADKYAAEKRAEADKYSADSRKSADEIVDRIKQEHEDEVGAARAEADRQIKAIRESVAEEQKRFEAARSASRRFAAEAVVLNRKQLEILRELMESAPTVAPEKPAEVKSAPAQSESKVTENTFEIPFIQPESDPEDERITERHAEDTAEAAAFAAETIAVGTEKEPTKRFTVNEPDTIRFEAIRRVDMGGETVEIDAEDDEQSADTFRSHFGGDDDGE